MPGMLIIFTVLTLTQISTLHTTLITLTVLFLTVRFPTIATLKVPLFLITYS